MTIRSTAFLLAASLALVPPGAAGAFDPVYATWPGLAIGGTDPITYFTERRPVAGSSAFATDWKGATWRCASAENRAKFVAVPERYARTSGGDRAWAVSQGKTASTDPEAWDIVDGRLYLNFSKDTQKKWDEEVPGNIRKADENSPRPRAGA